MQRDRKLDTDGAARSIIAAWQNELPMADDPKPTTDAIIPYIEARPTGK
jgi:hypothetical protein